MTATSCRWGILGTASIARKNWLAIQESGNGRLVAVASRQVDKARSFIAECQKDAPFETAPETVDGYAALLNRDDIDSVYIPLPTGLRKQWVIAAAKAGKHVLCEKPSGIDSNEVREMVAACDQAGVQYMDGVMFMHNPRLGVLKETVADGGPIGKIRRITTQFTFPGSEEFFAKNIRTNAELEPLGCLGDLGWYNIRFILWMMDGEMPNTVSARIIRHQEGVPMALSAELGFDSGVSASLYCSFDDANQQWAMISGTEGYLSMDDFVLPFHGSEAAFSLGENISRAEGCHFYMEKSSQSMPNPSKEKASQESLMFRKFGEIVESKETESYWPEIALNTQIVVDACMRSTRKGGHYTVI